MKLLILSLFVFSAIASADLPFTLPDPEGFKNMVRELDGAYSDFVAAPSGAKLRILHSKMKVFEDLSKRVDILGVEAGKILRAEKPASLAEFQRVLGKYKFPGFSEVIDSKAFKLSDGTDGLEITLKGVEGVAVPIVLNFKNVKANRYRINSDEPNATRYETSLEKGTEVENAAGKKSRTEFELILSDAPDEVYDVRFRTTWEVTRELIPGFKGNLVTEKYEAEGHESHKFSPSSSRFKISKID